MRHVIATSALALLAAAASAAGPALAAPASAGQGARPSPRSVLTLTRSKGDASSRSDRSTTTLSCEPSGGPHPKASQACADLVRSDGAVERPPSDLVCPMMFSPVTVTAVGLWRGRTVNFTATYGNECIMRARTGAVFGF